MAKVTRFLGLPSDAFFKLGELMMTSYPESANYTITWKMNLQNYVRASYDHRKILRMIKISKNVNSLTFVVTYIRTDGHPDRFYEVFFER